MNSSTGIIPKIMNEKKVVIAFLTGFWNRGSVSLSLSSLLAALDDKKSAAAIEMASATNTVSAIMIVFGTDSLIPIVVEIILKTVTIPSVPP